MKIEQIEIDHLRPYEKNSNKHSDWQIKKIADSITEFGFTQPILVTTDGTIVAGHGRALAASQVGMKTVPAIKLDMPFEKARAYVIADNQLARLAEWDHEILASEIVDLQRLDIDIDVLGFDDKELARIRNLVPDAGWPEMTQGNTDPDCVPVVDGNPRGVERGQVWQLDGHRVMCGDSTDKDDVDRLMDGEKADMVFTDPPYGMNLYTNWSRTTKGNHSAGPGGNKYKPVISDDDKFDPSVVLSIESSEIFLWGADYYRKSIPDGGSWVVWDKASSSQGIGTMDELIGSNFELCWSKQKHKREIARIAHKGLGSVEKEKRVHPTQKPVKLAEWFFERWGKDKNLIVDIFLGSGSTLIACEKTNRRCYGMEIDPHYCNVIIDRWEKFTGKVARIIEPIHVLPNGDVN